MARSSATTGWTALLALSLGSGCGSSDAGGGTTGQPGAGGAGAGDGSGGKGTTVASSSSAAIASATAGVGGSDAYVCDPPAAPGSIYELTGDSFAFVQPVSMCRYRGDVMLVVNTAAL